MRGEPEARFRSYAISCARNGPAEADRFGWKTHYVYMHEGEDDRKLHSAAYSLERPSRKSALVLQDLPFLAEHMVVVDSVPAVVNRQLTVRGRRTATRYITIFPS